MHTTMRFELFIVIVLLVLAPAQGVMRLSSGTDSYGKGLSYPDYPASPAIVHFVADDYTSQLASVFLGATLYRPEFRFINSTNRSYNYSFTWPLYRSYFDGIYTPLTAGDLWDYPWADQHLNYGNHAPSVKEFVQPGWRSPPADDQTPAIKDFMHDEDDWRTSERSSEDYYGADRFLKDDDRTPGSPLL